MQQITVFFLILHNHIVNENYFISDRPDRDKNKPQHSRPSEPVKKNEPKKDEKKDGKKRGCC